MSKAYKMGSQYCIARKILYVEGIIEVFNLIIKKVAGWGDFGLWREKRSLIK